MLRRASFGESALTKFTETCAPSTCIIGVFQLLISKDDTVFHQYWQIVYTVSSIQV